MFDVNKLKVGDVVGYRESHGGCLLSHGISTVEKVGKVSITLDNGMKFTMKGWKWGGTPYHCPRLTDAAELREEVVRKERHREIDALLYKAESGIEKILKSARGWNESRPITPAERVEMLALINAIPVEEKP